MNGRPGWMLLAESGLDLLSASIMLRTRSFEKVMQSLPVSTSHLAPPTAEVLSLARAQRAWRRRLPWRTECFEMGLAAYRYLNRHGYAATIHYGARGSGPSLEAHVWVSSLDLPVIGHENSDQFKELARFPAA